MSIKELVKRGFVYVRRKPWYIRLPLIYGIVCVGFYIGYAILSFDFDWLLPNRPLGNAPLIG